ncbi:MAG: hypothetical protein LBR38_03645 [Synergistaceae bacterium]|nr:hypothetical protein [Synergistaceae bacterium]
MAVRGVVPPNFSEGENMDVNENILHEAVTQAAIEEALSLVRREKIFDASPGADDIVHTKDLTALRAQALWLVESTIARPDLHTVNKKVGANKKGGRSVYSKLYSDGKDMLHRIVVEADNDGRVLTTFITRNSKKDKKAVAKKILQQIEDAEEIIYSSLFQK